MILLRIMNQCILWLLYSPIFMPTVTVQKNTTTQVRGSYVKIGILVQALYNLGECSSDIIGAVRSAMDTAKHDGVGQEA